MFLSLPWASADLLPGRQPDLNPAAATVAPHTLPFHEGLGGIPVVKAALEVTNARRVARRHPRYGNDTPTPANNERASACGTGKAGPT